MELSQDEWRRANAEARAREQRERETRYLLTMATLRHREDPALRVQDQNLIGGVPPGVLRFTVEVDALTFWRVLHELERRKGWT